MCERLTIMIYELITALQLTPKLLCPFAYLLLFNIFYLTLPADRVNSQCPAVYAKLPLEKKLPSCLQVSKPIVNNPYNAETH